MGGNQVSASVVSLKWVKRRRRKRKREEEVEERAKVSVNNGPLSFEKATTSGAHKPPGPIKNYYRGTSDAPSGPNSC